MNGQYGLKLSEEEKAFIKEWDIYLSDAYIGMMRAYCNNNTVWQTDSTWFTQPGALDAKFSGFEFGECIPDYRTEEWHRILDKQDPSRISVREQTHAWLAEMIGLSKKKIYKRLQANVPLFGGREEIDAAIARMKENQKK